MWWARLWFSICILEESELSAVSLNGLQKRGEKGLEAVNVYLLFLLSLEVAKQWQEGGGSKDC